MCSDFSLCDMPEWQQMYNMKNGPQNVLEVNEPYLNSLNFVQSAHDLTRTRPRFKIHFLSYSLYRRSWIGLTRRGYFSEWLNEQKTRDYHCLFEPELATGDVNATSNVALNLQKIF